MERAPLPPHERAWRHPSELAATHSAAVAAEPTTSTARILTLATGAATLLAVGVLVVSMTPDRSERAEGPATASTVASALLSVPRAAPVAATATPEPEVPTTAALPRVTPIGDGLMGVATSAAVRGLLAEVGPMRTIDAVLHSGAVVQVRVHDTDATDSGLMMLELVESAADPVAVADDVPDADDLVVVLTDPPVVVPLERVHEVGADDGTPVLDQSGQLVGLCTDDGRGARVAVVDPAAGALSDATPDDATTGDPD